jgi:hypothetical protein
MKSKFKPSGFYSSSLEMLLDTMCNMLGGVVFISLMVAMVMHDAPPVAREDYRQNAIQFTNELAAVTVSNTAVEAELQATARRLQDPHQHFRTNQMRLPNLSHTDRRPWPVSIRYDKLYPVDLMPAVRGGAPVRNDQAIARSEFAEPIAGRGEAPDAGIARMIAAFQTSGGTNYYFEFYVYEDSFGAFVRARDAAAGLGFQYGWEPLPANRKLRLSREAERVLPQN